MAEDALAHNAHFLLTQESQMSQYIDNLQTTSITTITEALHRAKAMCQDDAMLPKADFVTKYTEQYDDQCANYSEWKCTLKNRINTYENCLWETYLESHLHLSLLHQTFSEISRTVYWTIISLYPDLVPKLNIQLRLMVNFGLPSGLPWLKKESIDKCLFGNLE